MFKSIIIFTSLLTIIHQTVLTKKNHPKILLIPLIFFFSGIFLQKSNPTSQATILALTGLSLALAFVKQKLAFACIGFMFLGALSLSNQIGNYEKKQNTLPRKKATLIAQVLNKTNNEKNFYKQSLLLLPKNLKTNAKILCYQKRKSEIYIGDIVKLRNIKLNFPQKTKSITGNPTFREYLIKENVSATIFLKRTKVKKIGQIKNRLYLWLNKKRKTIFESLKNKMQNKTFEYFASIFLGKKLGSTDSRHTFGYWGISHHLARSGLHIGLFILMWSTILSFLPLFFILKHIFLIFICATYAILSWPSISFLRALSVFFLYEIGTIFNQQTTIFHLLSIITLAILCFNPMQIFFLDFQLSFGITLALTSIYSKKR